MNKIHLTIPGRNKLPEDYYRMSYGEAAAITRLGHINLIHLDFPSDATIRERVGETLREQTASKCDCHICRNYKNHPMDIVYLGPETGWPGLWPQG